MGTLTQNIQNGASDQSNAINNAVVTIGVPFATCTGTLITARHVLTAAHCTQGWAGASAMAPISAIGFGPNANAPILQRRFVGCVRHPNYYINQVPVTSQCSVVPTAQPTDAGMPTNQSGILSRHDVAILTLETPVPRAIAMPMRVELLIRPTLTNPAGQLASIAGFAPFMVGGGPVTRGLRQAGSLLLGSRSDGLIGSPYIQNWSDGGPMAQVNLGDSGGPLRWRGEELARESVIGIAALLQGTQRQLWSETTDPEMASWINGVMTGGNGMTWDQTPPTPPFTNRGAREMTASR